MTTTTISTYDMDMIREFVRTYVDNVIGANRLNWLQEHVAQGWSPFKAEDFEILGWDLHRKLTKADCSVASGLVAEILEERLRKRESEREAE